MVCWVTDVAIALRLKILLNELEFEEKYVCLLFGILNQCLLVTRLCTIQFYFSWDFRSLNLCL